jgi:hypothetical protein
MRKEEEDGPLIARKAGEVSGIWAPYNEVVPA